MTLKVSALQISKRTCHLCITSANIVEVMSFHKTVQKMFACKAVLIILCMPQVRFRLHQLEGVPHNQSCMQIIVSGSEIAGFHKNNLLEEAVPTVDSSHVQGVHEGINAADQTAWQMPNERSSQTDPEAAQGAEGSACYSMPSKRVDGRLTWVGRGSNGGGTKDCDFKECISLPMQDGLFELEIDLGDGVENLSPTNLDSRPFQEKSARGSNIHDTHCSFEGLSEYIDNVGMTPAEVRRKQFACAPLHGPTKIVQEDNAQDYGSSTPDRLCNDDLSLLDTGLWSPL